MAGFMFNTPAVTTSKFGFGSCCSMSEDISYITVEDARKHGTTGDIILKASTFTDTFQHRNSAQLAAKGMGGWKNLRRKYQYSHVGILVKDPPQDIKELYRVGTRVGPNFRVSDAGQKETVFVFESSASLGGPALRPLCDVIMHWMEGHNETHMHFVIRKLLPAQLKMFEESMSRNNLTKNEMEDLENSPLTRHINNAGTLTRAFELTRSTSKEKKKKRRKQERRKNRRQSNKEKPHLHQLLSMPSPNRLYRGMSKGTNMFLNRSIRKNNQLNHHVLVEQYHEAFLNLNKLWLWMRECHGKSYGISQQEMKVLGRRFSVNRMSSPSVLQFEDLKELFCSELVAECYQRMGLIPTVEEGGMGSSVILPLDFVQGKHVDDSLTFRFRLGPHLRMYGLASSVERIKELYPIQFTTAEEEVIRLRDDVKLLRLEISMIREHLVRQGNDLPSFAPLTPTQTAKNSAPNLPFARKTRKKSRQSSSLREIKLADALIEFDIGDDDAENVAERERRISVGSSLSRWSGQSAPVLGWRDSRIVATPEFTTRKPRRGSFRRAAVPNAILVQTSP